MKRIFLFGLLGAFAAFIYIAAIDLILLFIGTGYDFIRRRDEQWIFDFVGNYYFLESFFIVLIVIWLFLCWKFGFISKKLLFWKDKDIRLERAIVKTLLIGLICFLAGLLQTKNFFMPIDFSAYAISSYGSAYGHLTYFFVIFSPLIPLVFLVFSLSYVIAVFSNTDGAWKRLAIPLSGLVLLFLNIAAVLLLRSHLDLDKDISKIPGLSNKPEQRFIAILTGGNSIFKMEEYFDDFDCSPLKKNYVAFSDENAKVIQMYLKENRMSALRASGYNYLIGKSEQELNIKKESAYYLEAFKITNRTGFIIFLQNRLHVANVEPYFHKMLVETSDERFYSIKGKSALKVSRIYSKYGELDKAEYWYNKALETARITDEYWKKRFADGKPPKVPPFNGGKISGIVKADGMPSENTNVGLISSVNLKNFSEFQKGNSTLAKSISFINLMGGTVTDKEGQFTFDGLGEGEYVLLLSIKTQDNKTAKVLNSPGTITISKEKPTSDAGVIRLAY